MSGWGVGRGYAPASAPGRKKRKNPRRACRPASALFYVPWPDSLGRLGHAVDISPEGIAFLAEQPLCPGSS
jgi:hypothetical protein